MFPQIPSSEHFVCAQTRYAWHAPRTKPRIKYENSFPIFLPLSLYLSLSLSLSGLLSFRLSRINKTEILSIESISKMMPQPFQSMQQKHCNFFHLNCSKHSSLYINWTIITKKNHVMLMTTLMGKKTANTILRVFFDNSTAAIILSTICGFCSKMSLQIEFKFGHLTCQ